MDAEPLRQIGKFGGRELNRTSQASRDAGLSDAQDCGDLSLTYPSPG